jgi:hypothetical protein
MLMAYTLWNKTSAWELKDPDAHVCLINTTNKIVHFGKVQIMKNAIYGISRKLST